jgi:methylthioribose-1-phosphate isomerase
MKVGTEHFRAIWLGADGSTVQIIDQTRLPHDFVVLDLTTMDQAAVAIRDMWVRGAPLIGATAGYGMALQMAADPSDAGLAHGYATLYATRPTAVNLRWALDDMRTPAGTPCPLCPSRRRLCPRRPDLR